MPATLSCSDSFFSPLWRVKERTHSQVAHLHLTGAILAAIKRHIREVITCRSYVALDADISCFTAGRAATLHGAKICFLAEGSPRSRTAIYAFVSTTSRGGKGLFNLAHS